MISIMVVKYQKQANVLDKENALYNMQHKIQVGVLGIYVAIRILKETSNR